jgi:enoyl-CoA hydratase/carnithine racemase
MEERVRVELQNGVADVQLVRSDKMNALDPAMFEALAATGEKLKTMKGLRAVVLSGEGRAFCAGLDMSNFAKMASGERRGGAGLVDVPRTAGGANHAQQAVMVWREIPVPVIAAIHGVAFGGGFQLTLGADMRYVAPDTRLSILEIKWGLVPDMAGIALLRGLVRDDIVRELTYTGRIRQAPPQSHGGRRSGRHPESGIGRAGSADRFAQPDRVRHVEPAEARRQLRGLGGCTPSLPPAPAS